MVNNELESFCRERGIPVDRAKLVSRNLVLAEHVRACHKIITMQAKSIHECLNHSEPFDDCFKSTCVAQRDLLATLNRGLL